MTPADHAATAPPLILLMLALIEGPSMFGGLLLGIATMMVIEVLVR